MEKDVTLAIALKVKRILEKTGQYKVYLTRGKDEYLDLEKRAQIANKRGADIFVSIHANASPNRDGRGIESYILNWTDDEEAMKVAARENAITLRRMKEARSEIGLILASLELQAKRDDSLGLAHMIQGSLIKNVSDRYKDAMNLGVKQALFYVLVGAKMPSVLVEVSFISNPTEEKLLRKNEYRESIAEGISEGIIKYLSTGRPVQDKPKKEIALRF
jgi:N-acetylmuramoyl-L-alanine amidase